LNITIFQRIIKIYLTLGKTFGKWISPIFSGVLIGGLWIVVSLAMILDNIIWISLCRKKLKNPIVIVGNPRSGTTFLQRYMVNEKIGVGTELWQLLYPSLILQKLIRPLLPILEKISPARHHSTVAHKTSLRSVETDDVSILFRYLDGFFLYGFILSWADENVFDWFDPRIRNSSHRDFKWLSSIWKRRLISSKHNQIIAKLFSVSANTPNFQHHFPMGKILYMVRDPLSVIPSGLSLVTGVLDKKFGFWSLPEEKRKRYIDRLYHALVELLIRFHDDWVHDRIDKNRVLIVKYDRMMNQFDDLMEEILRFLNIEPTEKLMEKIKRTADSQRKFKSEHKYDLEKFGLSKEQIKNDCSCIYDTFLTYN